MDNNTPTKELNSRWKRYRELLHRYHPQADGVFIFSRVNIFYFTGTFANGVLWLPKEGEPILFCRRGAERAGIETPIKNIIQFNSYSNIEQTFEDIGITWLC
ncbi:MAG: aminopeptidase P family N-terminal domain-containing protein [Desulfocapsaceae bacterium]|nr:aminopeptidase P family N-terminal domain-containing protein [Desulfocapsaceae bacterium]